MVVAHACNPSTQEADASRGLSFKASLIYSAGSRRAKATPRNPVSEQNKAKKKKKNLLKIRMERQEISHSHSKYMSY